MVSGGGSSTSLRRAASGGSASGSIRAESRLSVDDALARAGCGRAQTQVVCVGGLLLTVDAMEMMLLSFLGPAVRCALGATPEQEALLSSAVFAGMLLGAYACGVLADRYGRRDTVQLLAVLTVVLGAASGLAQSLPQLMVARALVGACLGGSSVGFTLVMEFLPASHRGRWGVLLELFWSLGSLLEALLAWAVFEGLRVPAQWRILMLLTAAPALVAAAALLAGWVPRSPRFLLARGRREEALEVLKAIAVKNGRPLPAGARLLLAAPAGATGRHDEEGDEDEGEDASVRSGGPHLHELDQGPSSGNPLAVVGVLRALLAPELRRLTLCLWALWFLNALGYYAVVLLSTSLAVHAQTAGAAKPNSTALHCDPETGSPFAGSATFISVAIASLAEVPGTVLAASMVDTRLGRKRTLCALFTGAGVTLAIMALLSRGMADTLLLFLARLFVTAAFNVTYMYTPEAYPTQVRTTGFGVANSMGRFGGMTAPFLGATFVERGLATTALALLSLAMFLAACLSFALPVETRGKALADALPSLRRDGRVADRGRDDDDDDDDITVEEGPALELLTVR
jgi:MFS family permease